MRASPWVPDGACIVARSARARHSGVRDARTHCAKAMLAVGMSALRSASAIARDQPLRSATDHGDAMARRTWKMLRCRTCGGKFINVGSHQRWCGANTIAARYRRNEPCPKGCGTRPGGCTKEQWYGHLQRCGGVAKAPPKPVEPVQLGPLRAGTRPLKDHPCSVKPCRDGSRPVGDRHVGQYRHKAPGPDPSIAL